MIWLFIAFIVLPVVEIWLITQVAGEVGWLLTIFLVIFVSAAGAWLVRREGLGVIRRVRDRLRGGEIPTNDLADGAMIFFASALMLTPGFLTDAVGLALLIPPIRAILRPPVIAFFRRRLDLRVSGLTGGGAGPFGGAGSFGGFGTSGGPRRRGDVYDVDDDAIRRHPTDGPDEPGPDVPDLPG
ncbi:MAG: FxsA family protein [Actinomycetota bacterium]